VLNLWKIYRSEIKVCWLFATDCCRVILDFELLLAGVLGVVGRLCQSARRLLSTCASGVLPSHHRLAPLFACWIFERFFPVLLSQLSVYTLETVVFALLRRRLPHFQQRALLR
jgi:hypothetical protein